MRGNTIKLHCFVIGKPAPEVHWYKDGILVKGENRTISTLENTLLDITIRNPDCTHIGNYSCKAKNEHGMIEHNVKSVTAEGVIHTFYALNLYMILYSVDLGLPDAGSVDGCKESCCPHGLATVVKTCNMSDTG